MKTSDLYPEMFQNSDYGKKEDLPDYYSGHTYNFKNKETNEYEQDYFNFFTQKFSDDYSHDDYSYNDKPFGLKKSSSDDDIKKKYRELVLKFHPDKGGDEKQFIKIQEEWEKYKNRF